MKKKRNLSYFLVMAFVLVISVFLFQPASAQAHILTINIDPALGGTVSVNVNGGGYLPYTGPVAVMLLDHVSVQAIPANVDYSFSHWTDSLNNIPVPGINPTDFTVIGNHVVTAYFNFDPPPTCYTLTYSTSPAAAGSILFQDDPICPIPGDFEAGATPLITASANNGYKFDHWTGDPIGTIPPNPTNQIIVTMDQPRSVTAHFLEVCQLLLLTKSGSGADLIADPTYSTDCAAGSYTYKAGTPVLLTADPDPGWKVTSWDIGASNDPTEDNPYNLVMPALPFGESLTVKVNYEEIATFGFTPPAEQTVNENVGNVSIEVKWDQDTLPADATISYQTVNGTATVGNKDYYAKSGDLQFAAGDTTPQEFFITIRDDNVDEDQEYFYVDLRIKSGDVKLGLKRFQVIINDDETPTIRFKKDPYTIAEPDSATYVPVTIVVSPIPLHGLDVFVDFYTEDDTATAGPDGDYAAFPISTQRLERSNDYEKTINILVRPDELDEPDEEIIKLKLTKNINAALASDSNAELIISDNDSPPSVAFSQSEYYIKKAGNTQALIPVNLSAPSGRKVKVDYIVTHEQSGNVQEGTLSFAAGSQTETLHIPITSANPEDVFTMQLSDPQNADLGTPNTASLFVLSTDTSDCHDLTLNFNGHGLAPAAISKSSSIGCPSGQYVEGELIDIVAQPKHGWYVAAWQGTMDDQSTSLQNVVKMPNKALTVNVDYRVPVFFSMVSFEQPSFAGPCEEEPNSLFSQANGPLIFNRDYCGNFSSASDDHDFFYFELEVKASVTITLNDIPNGRDYDLALYDEEWIPIAASREYDSAPEKVTGTLLPGKYFIQVYSGEDSEPSTANYRLRVGVN